MATIKAERDARAGLIRRIEALTEKPFILHVAQGGISAQTQPWLGSWEMQVKRAIETVQRLERRRETRAKKAAREARQKQQAAA